MNQLQKIRNKIKSVEELLEELAELRSAGKSVAFTNGCFDILHKGHVEYLSQSSDHADLLVIGLNTDESVRQQQKGDDRPINSLEARATVLAGLGFVDFVVPFQEQTPLNLIQEIRPDVLLKGADYDPTETDSSSKKYIVGSQEVRAFGGRVRVIPLVEGFSTTSLINKMKS